MAGSVNRVMLLGHLGRDPEVRTTQAGKKVASMSLATSESWNDRQSGERKERTEWHRVVVMNEHLAEIAEKFLRKGSKVWVEGALQTRKYTDKEGVERWVTEIVLGQFKSTLLGLDARGDGNAGETQHNAARPAAQATSAGSRGWEGTSSGRSGPGGGRGDGSLGGGSLDDEIPFAACWQ